MRGSPISILSLNVTFGHQDSVSYEWAYDNLATFALLLWLWASVLGARINVKRSDTCNLQNQSVSSVLRETDLLTAKQSGRIAETGVTTYQFATITAGQLEDLKCSIGGSGWWRCRSTGIISCVHSASWSNTGAGPSTNYGHSATREMDTCRICMSFLRWGCHGTTQGKVQNVRRLHRISEATEINLQNVWKSATTNTRFLVDYFRRKRSWDTIYWRMIETLKRMVIITHNLWPHKAPSVLWKE